MPPSSSKTDVQMFLGMVNYYRRFIPNLSRIEAPISKLVSEPQFAWPKDADVAFGVIMNLCAETLFGVPVTQCKVNRRQRRIRLKLGAVISHIDSKGIEKPIAFASRTIRKRKVDSYITRMFCDCGQLQTNFIAMCTNPPLQFGPITNLSSG